MERQGIISLKYYHCALHDHLAERQRHRQSFSSTVFELFPSAVCRSNSRDATLADLGVCQEESGNSVTRCFFCQFHGPYAFFTCVLLVQVSFFVRSRHSMPKLLGLPGCSLICRYYLCCAPTMQSSRLRYSARLRLSNPIFGSGKYYGCYVWLALFRTFPSVLALVVIDHCCMKAMAFWGPRLLHIKPGYLSICDPQQILLGLCNHNIQVSDELGPSNMGEDKTVAVSHHEHNRCHR